MPMFQAFQAIERCILLVILFLDDNLIMPLPSGYLTVCYGKSQFLIGRPSISMVIFHGYVTNNQIFPNSWDDDPDDPI